MWAAAILQAGKNYECRPWKIPSGLYYLRTTLTPITPEEEVVLKKALTREGKYTPLTPIPFSSIVCLVAISDPVSIESLSDEQKRWVCERGPITYYHPIRVVRKIDPPVYCPIPGGVQKTTSVPASIAHHLK